MKLNKNKRLPAVSALSGLNETYIRARAGARESLSIIYIFIQTILSTKKDGQAGRLFKAVDFIERKLSALEKESRTRPDKAGQLPLLLVRVLPWR
ncbi:hypothetical protein [Desulfuromonas thiophila]|uniref:hypothetical protein n=1 Tax=Desulfuromonas thiophila TaxID=57664 RepID=UPI0029F54D12|nr:hypothetical protein [Desulfuromonas thiophila]